MIYDQKESMAFLSRRSISEVIKLKPRGFLRDKGIIMNVFSKRRIKPKNYIIQTKFEGHEITPQPQNCEKTRSSGLVWKEKPMSKYNLCNILSVLVGRKV